MKDPIHELRNLIARNEIALALKFLQNLLHNSPKLDEVILQSARFQSIREQIRSGKISHEDAMVGESQIRSGILELVRVIDESLENAVFKEEISKAVNTTVQNAEKIYNIEKLDLGNFS
ncbi:MAG: hypothetical protein HRU41_14955 [Saprospiraceae bacterium]|nr:hypothetical protein [Saprospiraceae bacterium]